MNQKIVLWLASVLCGAGIIILFKGPDLPAPVQIPSEIRLVMQEPPVLHLQQPTIGVNWPIETSLIHQPPLIVKVSCEEPKKEEQETITTHRYRHHYHHYRRRR